jgi:hypothetical protein
MREAAQQGTTLAYAFRSSQSADSLRDGHSPAKGQRPNYQSNRHPPNPAATTKQSTILIKRSKIYCQPPKNVNTTLPVARRPPPGGGIVLDCFRLSLDCFIMMVIVFWWLLGGVGVCLIDSLAFGDCLGHPLIILKGFPEGFPGALSFWGLIILLTK